MVHGEDIRRPLGATGVHPPEHLITLAEMYKKTGAPDLRSLCTHRGFTLMRDENNVEAAMASSTSSHP